MAHFLSWCHSLKVLRHCLPLPAWRVNGLRGPFYPGRRPASIVFGYFAFPFRFPRSVYKGVFCEVRYLSEYLVILETLKCFLSSMDIDTFSKVILFFLLHLNPPTPQADCSCVFWCWPCSCLWNTITGNIFVVWRPASLAGIFKEAWVIRVAYTPHCTWRWKKQEWDVKKSDVRSIGQTCCDH